MADSSSDVEINVDDVCDSMAAGDHGVEVETIIQGQAPLPGQADELDFMVQEEVETTTDGDTLTVELDPVDNVIIALQNTDGLQGGGHFDEQNGGLCETLAYGSSSSGIVVGRERAAAAGSGRKRRSGGAGAGGGREGGGRLGASAKKKSRKMRKGAVSVHFTNLKISTVLGSSAASKETREANEASFDASKSPRRWRKHSVPVRTLEGQFAVAMWSTDQRKQMSEDGGDDFFEYTRGKKIPPEGIPGFDFSDPDSIVEFTKKTKMQKKRDADGVERTIPCPHKASPRHKHY
jgi:transcription factor YY